MSNWGIRRVAFALLALYVGVGLTIVLWPTPVDRDLHSELMGTLAALHAVGVPSFVNYAFVESSANVAMFTPLGILVTLMWARRLWWIAPTVGLVASSVAELAQYLFLPDRVATIADIVANAAGALLGTLVVVAVRRGRTARRTLHPLLVPALPTAAMRTLQPQPAEARAA